MAKEQSKTKKAVKITAISLASLIGAFILIVLIYVIYVAAQYYRIKDNLSLEVKNAQTETVPSAKSIPLFPITSVSARTLPNTPSLWTRVS